MKTLVFDREDVAVPTGKLRNPVVSNAQGLLVSLRQRTESDDGDELNAQRLRGLQPAMACDHLEIVSDEYGIGEAEALDRILDQLELLPRMRPGVAWIGPQPVR